MSTVRLLVSEHINRVAWGSSASSMSGLRALSLVLHIMSVPVSRSTRFRDQLELDGKGNSEIVDGARR